MNDNDLKLELKRLIVEACEKDNDPASIRDDATLVGFGSVLGLDSLDALQINVAIQRRFGVRIEDGKHARRVMKNINALAEFVSTATADAT